MKYSNQIGSLSALAVIVACFLVWITIPGLDLKITGFASEGTRFGKPGLVNCFMSGIALILFCIPRIWAKRANLFFAGFNLAWAIRNYILLTSCQGGECPKKQAGIYLLMGASIVLISMAVFPDFPLDEEKRSLPNEENINPVS